MDVSILSDASGEFSSGHDTLFNNDSDENINSWPITQTNETSNSTQVNPVLLDDESDNGTTQSQTLLNKDSTQDSGTSASFALVVTSDDIDLQPVLDDARQNARHYNKKVWTKENFEYTFDDDEWRKVIDANGSFIRGVSVNVFHGILNKYSTNCELKCSNKYSGSFTWTMIFKCKRCSNELKFTARITKTFTLFSSGTGQCS